MILEERNKRKARLLHMVELAVLTAVVLVLQLTGLAIKLPFLATGISLVLVPIVLGGMLLGPWAGAWLGFVFGLVVYVVGGVMATDVFTYTLFSAHPIITAIICFGKGIGAGFLPGLMYRLLEKWNSFGATVVASVLAPVVNTGWFIAGCLTIQETLKGFAGDSSVIYFLFIGCAGFNFLFELLVNVLFAPALFRVETVVRRRLMR